MRKKSPELDSYFKDPKVPFVALSLTSNFDIPRADRSVSLKKGNRVPCLTTNPQHHLVATSMGRVRKVTPAEYDSLMSWEKDHTKFGIEETTVIEIPKTHRYRLGGNGVVSNMIKQIVKVAFE